LECELKKLSLSCVGQSVRRWLLVFGILAWSSGAFACAICAPSDSQNTFVSRLLAADRIVLAQPDRSMSQAQAKYAVRGELPVDAVPIHGYLAGVQESMQALTPQLTPPPADALLVLFFNSGSKTWWVAGSLPAGRLSWLTALAAMPRVGDVPPSERASRAAFFAATLQDVEPLIAQTSYDELASFPYSVLRIVSARLQPKQVSSWVENSQLRARWPLYYLLWGFKGVSKDATAIEAHLLRADPMRTMAEWSSMLAAMVELRGVLGLKWVEDHVLTNPTMTDEQVRATVLALSVHAVDGTRVSQEQIVQVYARYIASNPQRAGLVASDLGTWGRWEFAQALGEALSSGREQVFSSRYAIVIYLLRNPTPEARSVVERLKAAKLM
jgi:hypothetical protein